MRHTETFVANKKRLREDLATDVQKFLSDSGIIEEVGFEATGLASKQANQNAKHLKASMASQEARRAKLSEKELDRRLAEFAALGKVTLA